MLPPLREFLSLLIAVCVIVLVFISVIAFQSTRATFIRGSATSLLAQRVGVFRTTRAFYPRYAALWTCAI